MRGRRVGETSGTTLSVKAKAPPCPNSTLQTPLSQQSSSSAREEDHCELREERRRRRRRIAFENLAKGMLRYLDNCNEVKVGITELQERVEVPAQIGISIQQVAKQAMNEDGQKISEVFCSVTMRAAWLSQQSPNIYEAAMSSAQSVSKRTKESWIDWKRLARYLAGTLRTRWIFEEQRGASKRYLRCRWTTRQTRKNTTSVLSRVGVCVVRRSSNMQSTASLCSRDSKYDDRVNAGADAWTTLPNDWRIDVQIVSRVQLDHPFPGEEEEEESHG